MRAVRDGALLPLGGARPRLVLALLAAAQGRSVSSEQLIDGLWPDDPPPTARKSVQVHVSALRRALGSQAIESTSGGYALQADVDATHFETLIAQAAIAAGNDHTAAVEDLDRALPMWRGDPYGDLADELALVGERSRLQELYEQARVSRLRSLLELGRHEESLGELEALVNAMPYREELRGLQMLALYRSGRQGEALRAYQEARRVLGEDLGIEPSPALQMVEQRILDQDPALIGPTARTRSAIPSTLPSYPIELVGRADDLEAMQGLLAGARLVTVVGVGGAGKTSLAVESAHQAHSSFPGGAFFVDLTSITEEGDVIGATMDGVGLSVIRAEPTIDRLVDFLRPRKCLLLMDNCEHVVAGAADLISQLLQHCPDLVVLATSREALAIPGEHAFQIPLLESATFDSPGIELFLRRAKEANSSFDLDNEDRAILVEICRRLDGIPLAIELAASQARSMSVREIGDRLDDRFGLLAAETRDPVRHHQTLLAAIEWSYSLLDEREQAMLRRLSVFQGGFDLIDVPAVTNIADPEATALVGALASKSLVDWVRERGLVRRRLLETIRLFASDKLGAAGERDAATERHHDHFIGSMRGTSFNRNNNVAELYQRNERELSNLIAALEWGIEHGRDADSALTVARVFWPLVYRGVAHKYQHLLDSDYDLPPEDQALLLTGRLMRAFNEADPAPAPAITEAARKLDPDGELEDSFFPQVGAFGFAPVEGAEERLAFLDELLPRAERSSTPAANVAMLEMHRSGQLYSLGRLEDALVAARRASHLATTGGLVFWDEVLAEAGLMVLLGRREDAVARVADLGEHSAYEVDLLRAMCALTSPDPRNGAVELARSARHHVSGRIYLQEGDYLCLFAAFRAVLGNQPRADDLLDAIKVRYGVIQWLVWPVVWKWQPESFVAGNTKARHRELERMLDPDWDATTMVELLAEELAFWDA